MGGSGPEFKAIQLGELDDLRGRHPILADSTAHRPADPESLRACPDIRPDFVCFTYVVQDGRVVSSVRFLPDTLWAGDQRHPWAWAGALWTDPEYRGRGLAGLLWDRSSELLNQRGVAMAGAFANPATTHISRKVGFTVTNRAATLLLLKSARPFLKHHVKQPVVAGLLEALYQVPVAGLKLLTRRPGLLSEVAVTPRATLAGLDLKELWPAQGPVYAERFHFNDGADKVRWKLERSKDWVLYHVTERASEKPLLYLIVKNRHIKHAFAEKYTDFKLMTLMDYGFFTRDERNADLLLAVVDSLLWQSDAEVLQIVTSFPEIIARARRKGHLKVGRGVAFWYKAPADWRLGPGAEDIARWRFTHFASDAFSFP